jgi:hypothetical protein
LPDAVKGKKPVRKRFKSYPVGFFHIDIDEVQTSEGKPYLFVAIDRARKFVFVQLHSWTGKVQETQFLRDFQKVISYPFILSSTRIDAVIAVTVITAAVISALIVFLIL